MSVCVRACVRVCVCVCVCLCVRVCVVLTFSFNQSIGKPAQKQGKDADKRPRNDAALLTPQGKHRTSLWTRGTHRHHTFWLVPDFCSTSSTKRTHCQQSPRSWCAAKRNQSSQGIDPCRCHQVPSILYLIAGAWSTTDQIVVWLKIPCSKRVLGLTQLMVVADRVPNHRREEWYLASFQAQRLGQYSGNRRRKVQCCLVKESLLLEDEAVFICTVYFSFSRTFVHISFFFLFLCE